jgi:ABC-2 type transport system permease protein
MKSLLKILLVETKLFFREPAAWVIALLLPPFVLLVLGSLPSLRSPQELFGGQRQDHPGQYDHGPGSIYFW